MAEWRPSVGIRALAARHGYDQKRDGLLGEPLACPPPDPFPRGWRLVESARDGYAADQAATGLRVIVSRSRFDGAPWTHLSASKRNRRLPSWAELVSVRDALLGPDREAYQVLPPAERHVNLHPGVLHLWSPDDGPALPDFSRRLPDGTRTI